MRFEIISNAVDEFERTLIYRPTEYSFDTVSTDNRRFTSVLLDDLNLEIDESDQVIAVWGLCPHPRWINAVLELPTAKQNTLKLINKFPFQRGVSVRLNEGNCLPVYADRKVGLIQIRGTKTPAVAIAIFHGVVVELTEQGEFCSLWLKPQNGMT